MLPVAIKLAYLLPVELARQLPSEVSELLISGVAIDSRQVQAGNLFIGLRGSRDDGARHVREAAARGARLAFLETAPPDTGIGITPAAGAAPIPCFAVARLRALVGDIADRCAGMPSAGLSLVGITGTNGKTTVSWLLAQLLHGLGLPCAVMGTLGSGMVGEIEGGRLTTADVVSNHQRLAQLRLAGARAAAMEVSSHALDQARIAGLRFAVAVFTNLTRDHLDYHGSMEAYAAAKAQLLRWPTLFARVINLDDAMGRSLAAESGARLLTYSIADAGADVCFSAEASASGEVVGHLRTPVGDIRVQTSLIGDFNASNLAAAIAAAIALGYAAADIAPLLPQLTAAPGRMQRFGRPEDVLAVVDYAHTPDGLQQALSTLRSMTRGRLWCVFGCGGDRDRGKRPLMAAIADALADSVVLTDDNPRTEDPEQIFADARSLPSTHAQWQCVHDRATAIDTALRAAQAGDVVLIAGKGHENYQEVGGERRPFSDVDVVRESLQRRAA